MSAAHELVRYLLTAGDAKAMTPSQLARLDVAAQHEASGDSAEVYRALHLVRNAHKKPATVAFAMERFKATRDEVKALRHKAFKGSLTRADLDFEVAR